MLFSWMADKNWGWGFWGRGGGYGAVAKKKAESELRPWEPTSEVLQGLGHSFQPFAKVLIRHRLIYRRKEEGPDKGFDHLKGRFDILYSPHWLDIAVSREFHNRASSADAGGILFSQS